MNVRFHTNLGDLDVNLIDTYAPKTVANFLNYVNRGDFNNSIIHRSVPGFIIQGGGYQLVSHVPTAIAQDAAVKNEFAVSNTRGTLAMAKMDGDPNSATNQWFFNTMDNSRTLNNQNGGFTVFGRVFAASLPIMDKIAALPVPNPAIFSAPFDQIPLIDYVSGSVTDANYVTILSITMLDANPVIAANGVVTASSFGGARLAAPGSFIEIYGASLAGTTRGWAGSDFTDGNAPTTLDKVSATVNGQAAFVNFVSPGQVNLQVPGNVPSGTAIPVILNYDGKASSPVTFIIQPLAGGLLAPALFKVDGKQYVAAVHSKTGAFVSNGTIAGVVAAPAAPGETLVMYGTGFGAVTPISAVVAGKVAQGVSALSTAVQFTVGGAQAEVGYAGLAPGLVGVYQFNVTVPANAANGDLAVAVTLGGAVLPQSLFLSVQGPAAP